MSDNRAFRYALGASLALHVLVLASFPNLIDTARRAASLPPIIARLMEPAPEPVPVPAPPPEKKLAEKKPAPPRVAKPVPRAETPIVRAETPPVVEAPAAAPEPAPVVPPPPLAAIEPQPVPSPAPQAAPAAPPIEVPESVSRDQYRVQLIDEARRHKRYPALARENNWQGDVKVGVAIAPNGRPTVTLRGSSGYEVLDRQALEMFMRAARAVPIPSALRGKEFTLEVRAVYGLED